MSSESPHFFDDLSDLPDHAHGNRSLTWWGMMGMIAIESTAFVLAIAAYFYLANQTPQWPPHLIRPSINVGLMFTAIAVLSAIPNAWLKKKAENEQLRGVQIGLVVMSIIGIATLVVRYFEFPALHVSWDQSAYGSIVVTLLGLHTVHLATDLVDTLVLTALMFTKHAYGRRYVDTAENCIYWYFVILAWIPIFIVIYFVPGWL